MNYILNFPRMLSCSIQQYKTKAPPNIPASLDNKLAIITGGNSGIGLETARHLSKLGCEVIILCRNAEKGSDVALQLNTFNESIGSEGKCCVIVLDLANLNSVKTCAAELRTKLNGRCINFFICNGGIMMQPYSKSAQGHEIHFATNHLGHFALVGCLLDLLRASSSRIVVVTGDIALLADDASCDFQYSDSGLMAYCRSKICNQSFALQLHERYGGDLTRVYCVHRGHRQSPGGSYERRAGDDRRVRAAVLHD
jgi:NAD(P)-dependent dehydrogenase (short-subunit alcohol dehydrogenase family)